MDITEVSIIHHVAIVLLVIWLLSSFNSCYPVIYFISLIYLYLVHENFSTRFRRKARFEERRQANQKRVLSDSESVRWLNHLVERIWPICMENIVSQRILLPIIPWFLDKYKPWTVKEAVVQNLYMGRSPPMITEMRVCRQSTGDDHLVLELGMNFVTTDDMSAILAAKLTKRLGFGMSAKMHITGMHVEGKVLAGIKFLPKWPFLGRLRVCFVEPPYFQMTVKPIFAHGLDVTEVPGIAGWLDKLLTVAFEETLVEPNMLVVDVEKFVSPEKETWFSVDAKEPVGYAVVEIVEGTDMKPSDMNGLADPYIKGQLGAYRFKTKIQKKTLSPKWYEEFKIPIPSWDSLDVLEIQVRDKDHLFDDILGDCCVKINDFRDGERHEIWLPLNNIKTGRLHLAVRVIEGAEKIFEQSCGAEKVDGSVEKTKTETDSFEPIDVEGQRETGIWVHRPGPEVKQVWEPRKGKNRVHKDSESVCSSSIKSETYPNDSSSTDENLGGSNTPKSGNMVKRGFRKVGSLFHRSPKPENDKSPNLKKMEEEECDSPHENVRSLNEKGIGVKLVMENNHLFTGEDPNVKAEEESDVENMDKKKVRGRVKGILKSTGNSAARGLMHVISRKGSNKGKDGDLGVQSDSSCEVGSIPSPGYRPDSELSPDGHPGPGQMDISQTPLSLPTEVNVHEPDTVRINDIATGKADFGKTADDGHLGPGQMDIGGTPLSLTTEVDVHDPDTVRTDQVDLNPTSKGDVEYIGKTAHETPP